MSLFGSAEDALLSPPPGPLFNPHIAENVTDELRNDAKSLVRSSSAIRTAMRNGDPLAVVEAFTLAVTEDPSIPADVLLPLLFTLEGEPYTLKDHWMYSPLFRMFNRPKITTVRAARQTGKTQNVSGQDVLKCAVIPNYKQVNITPLYEMSRRWSANYIKPLIDGCNIPGIVTEIGKEGQKSSVLQRTFPNGSSIVFTFAYLDCERVRGLSASELGIDEIQSMQSSFIPVIREILSGSILGFERYSGTPKTLDNPIEKMLWAKSSKGHWMVWCNACNSDNIFSEHYSIRANIGKHGPICRNCGAAIDCKPRKATSKHPASGLYVHEHPDRMWAHLGYHIPQCVHPRHTDIPHKWATLVEKMEEMPEAQFDNECSAISSDVGTKLVTEAQLKRNATRETMTLDRIRDAKASGEWDIIVSATDWSGKGSSRKSKRAIEETGLEFNSYTAQAIVGLRRGARLPEVLYLDRYPYDTDYAQEAHRSVHTHLACGADIYAHDFTGAGAVKEVLAKQYGIDRGLNVHSIMPILYTSLGPDKPILKFTSTAGSVQHYYSLDKHRALMLVALLLQKGRLPLPKWDAPAPNGKEKMSDLISDWLSLFEDTHTSPRGRKMVTIQKDPDRPDDVADAITMACCCIWHTKGWPDLAQYVTDHMAWDNTHGADPESTLPLGDIPTWEGSI